MPSAQEKKVAQADTRSVASGSDSSSADDNKLLEIGYVPSFKREFSNLATVRSLHLVSYASTLTWVASSPM